MLRYKIAPKYPLSGPFGHSGVGRNPEVAGPVRSYNLVLHTPVRGTRAMPPWLNDNCPQGRGGPRTAPPGLSNRSSHGRTVGTSVPDYGPHRQWSRAAPAVPNVPCAPVAIYAIPRSMDGGRGRCRSPQAGMVSLTIVPCLYSAALSSGSVAPYMASRPEPDWTHSFPPGFLISVTVIHRPMPLVGIPVPETSSWTAMPIAAASVSSWGKAGLRARVARMPGPESAMTASKAWPGLCPNLSRRRPPIARAPWGDQEYQWSSWFLRHYPRR